MFQFLFCKGHSYSRRVVAFSVRMLWSRDRLLEAEVEEVKVAADIPLEAEVTQI